MTGSPDNDPARDTDRDTVTLDRATLLDHCIFGFEHGDPRARPFTMLRSQILRRLDRIGGRIIAVTSAEPRNGKSFVAGNLAAALSQIHPTWLVDLDLRDPSVAQRLGIAPVRGVDDYLLGDARLGALRCTMDGDTVMAAPVAAPHANSAEILASPRLAELFATLRSLPEPTVCIVDTPPVLEGDDMMIIARHVDAVLMVVEEGRTRQSEVRECLRMIHPTPVIGSVLNRTIMSRQTVPYGQYHAR